MNALRKIIIGIIVAMGLGIFFGVVFLALTVSKAEAGTLYTGAVSHHIGGGDYCETHPLLAYEGSGYMGGAYRNSHCDWTAFAGRRWAWQPGPSVELAATVGAMVGYGDHVANVGGVSPLVLLEVQTRIDWARPTAFLLGNAIAFSPGWRVDW